MTDQLSSQHSNPQDNWTREDIEHVKTTLSKINTNINWLVVLQFLVVLFIVAVVVMFLVVAQGCQELTNTTPSSTLGW